MRNRSLLSYTIGLFAVILLLSACNARRHTSLFNAPSDIVTDTISQVYVVNDQGLGDFYRVKPEDRIILRNLQDREFLGETGIRNTTIQTNTNIASNQEFEVDELGFVNLPAVGKVQVVGLTRKELTKKMQQVFEANQIKDGIIEATIINLKVTLLGEFAKPGNYLLQRDNINLTEILGEAGNITAAADPRTLKIFRGDRANPEIIHVNLNDYKSLGSKKLILQNNDLIIIQQQKSVATMNKLQSLNTYIQPVLILLNLALVILTISK